MSEHVTNDPILLFKALSEPLRLRILCVLEVAEFSVVELTEALETPQSTISRHLAKLREANLVSTRRQGALVFYSRGPVIHNGLGPLMKRVFSALPERGEDLASAQRVLDRRKRLSRHYFDTMARRYSQMIEPGGSWRALTGALALAFDGRIIADIGAGEGELALRLARSAKRVYAIDQSPEMVKLIAERTDALKNVTAREGDFESLPLRAGACDVAIVSQVLHHCPRPRVALGEAFRILRPEGRLILLDLSAHEQEWTRKKLGDHWLGFDLDELGRWMKEAGFVGLQDFTEPTGHEGLTVCVVSGKKKA